MSNTKIAISNAFIDLSKRKSIDKITVKELVDSCNITRQTFYYHFQDIMDLIEWSLSQKMEEILHKSLQAQSMIEAIRVLISLTEDHPEIVNKLMGSQRREETERLFFVTIRTYMEDMIDKKELFMNVRQSDIKIALDFYSYAIRGILLEIISSRKVRDLDWIAQQIYNLITGKMFIGEEENQ